MNKKLYLLHYVKEFEDGHEAVKLLGAFSSKKKAKEALSTIVKKNDLEKIYELFEIDAYTIDRIGWEEGYVTV